MRHIAKLKLNIHWGLTVSTVGYQHIAPGEAYPPKGHPQAYSFQAGRGRVLDEYQFVYISRGRGVFESKSLGQATVGEGDLFLLFPGEWHSYRPDETTGWDEYWIGFKGLNIDSRVSNGFFLPREPIFHVGLSEDIVQLYRNAIAIASEQSIGFQQMLGGEANMLLDPLMSLTPSTWDTPEYEGLPRSQALWYRTGGLHRRLA